MIRGRDRKLRHAVDRTLRREPGRAMRNVALRSSRRTRVLRPCVCAGAMLAAGSSRSKDIEIAAQQRRDSRVLAHAGQYYHDLHDKGPILSEVSAPCCLLSQAILVVHGVSFEPSIRARTAFSRGREAASCWFSPPVSARQLQYAPVRRAGQLPRAARPAASVRTGPALHNRKSRIGRCRRAPLLSCGKSSPLQLCSCVCTGS